MQKVPDATRGAVQVPVRGNPPGPALQNTAIVVD